jgi:hypothetical protein
MSISDNQRAFFGRELQAEIKSLISDSIHSNTTSLFRSIKLVKTIATHSAQQKVTGFELAERWSRFNLEASHIINRCSQKAVSDILDALEHYGLIESTPADTPDSSANGEKCQDKIEIDLSARKGEKAKASFIIANPGSEDMKTVCTVTDFVSEEGHSVSSKGVQFSPATLRLSPHKEAPVEITVPVDHKFRVDKHYIATIELSGQPKKELLLKLHILRSTAAKPRVSKAGKTKKRKTR